ncbi:MAG: O-succinylhomoserine sulfhydrylase [Gammaproteobacteria bacterium]|nr:O-succinylhomoserine sulfhydrylase [Gammaproteobacteria bacterium]
MTTNIDFDGYGADTIAIRAGQQRTAEGEHNDPIFATSSFIFKDAKEAAARFKEEEPGNVYSRFTNPTVRTFERRLAALEGGAACAATASGMGAILAMALAYLKAGDHVVAGRNLFGSTVTLFSKILKKFCVTTTFVDMTNHEAWEAAIQSNTRLFFLESPSNPLAEIANIPALAELAHANNCLLAVDNCFCTPALQKPIELGADIVIHSATKYLDGQGRCVGGAVVVKNEDAHGNLVNILRSGGPSMSPFNAWVFLKGLELLRLRMEAHSAAALDLAQWLEQHRAVTKVYYAGLPSHPQHELAKKQQSTFGGILSFEVSGDRREAWRIIDATRFLSITGNLGDVKTTIVHPATTTHGRLTQEQRDSMGIKENLIRLSVGLESIEDIKADLEHGLSK